MKIGFFDSGIGELSVLHEAYHMLPGVEFIFYADTDHVPYITHMMTIMKIMSVTSTWTRTTTAGWWKVIIRNAPIIGTGMITRW